MKDFFNENKKTILVVGGIVLGIALIFLIIKLVGNAKEAAECESGIEYLEEREATEPAAVKQKITQIVNARMEAEKRERFRQLQSGEINVWSLFNSCIVLGDSRASGFSVYNYLPANQVIAHNGDTTRSMLKSLNEIKVFNPSMIVCAYGLNDVWDGLFKSGDEFAEYYMSQIKALKEAVPGATIYVSSIMPTTDRGIQRNARAASIPEFNASLKKACQANGYIYIDNDKIARENFSMYYDDGVHQAPQFYPIWASNIMTTVYEVETKAEHGLGN